MAQNIYDNPTFFTSYSQLPRSQDGLSAAPEWPILKSMIQRKNISPSSHVLDLGCGYGWFCRWAAQEAGASQVHGIDISEKMLARAREMGSSISNITYEQGDIDQVRLAEDSYDLVYSSLAIHYLDDFEGLVGRVHRALKRGGQFVFSVEHPVYTAPKKDKWYGSEDGEKFWLLNEYGKEGPRVRNWLGEDVRKYHRTIQTYLSILLRGGFALVDFVEWMPSEKDLEEHPDWSNKRHRPAFLLVAVERIEI